MRKMPALAVFFIPAVSRLSITSQREIGAALGERAKPIIDVVAPAILLRMGATETRGHAVKHRRHSVGWHVEH